MILKSNQLRLASTDWVCAACRRYHSTVPKAHNAIRRDNQRLPLTATRTRFAPSPTGYLHLGSLRTALYNFLLARATGGKFILRLEDTDRERTIPGAEASLYDDLRWAGLQWDEGPDCGGSLGPYRQSERTLLYKDHAVKLIRLGHAYRCFCSRERLQSVAQQQHRVGLQSGYDRACKALLPMESEERAAKGDSHVVRLEMPSKPPVLDDLVYGIVGRSKEQEIGAKRAGMAIFEDPIILKSDGWPTYHLANVVDDHLMEITHVIRAVEWMSSTPKHLLMFKAFGWTPPKYAHVGLLQDSGRQKFSKRNQVSDLNVSSFRTKGYFPETLLNYTALFGWSHSARSDVLNLEDLIEHFDLKFTKGNTIVQPTKLNFLQKQFAIKYISEGGAQLDLIVNQVLDIAKSSLADKASHLVIPQEAFSQRITSLLHISQNRYVTPSKFFADHFYFFRDPTVADFTGIESDKSPTAAYRTICLISPQTAINHCLDLIKKDYIHQIHDLHRNWPSEEWNAKSLKDLAASIGKQMADQHGIDPSRASGAVNSYLRWAVAGARQGPGMAETMELLGQDVCVQRLAGAEKMMSEVVERMKGHEGAEGRAGEVESGVDDVG